MDKDQTKGSSEEITASPVTPEQAGNDSGNNEAEGQKESGVPAVLPLDDIVLAEITDIGDSGLSARLEQHPADMREPETVVGIVRVQLGVGVSVMGAVATRPPFNGTLHSSGSCHCENILQRLGSVVGPVGPETMVPSSDTWEKLLIKEPRDNKWHIPSPVTK